MPGKSRPMPDSALDNENRAARSVGKIRLSKIGNARLRKALHLPAVVAMRYNPILRTFAQRLLERGKPKMAVVGAVMRKLLHQAYGVLKHGQPFDPNYALNH
jgi:transposase